jgi:hypothetical protein
MWQETTAVSVGRQQRCQHVLMVPYVPIFPIGVAWSGLKLANVAVDNIDVRIRVQESNLFFNFVGC